MREVDTSRIWRDVVAGAEMAGRKRRYWQLRGRFDSDAIVPIGTYRNPVELVTEADVKQLSSATAPDWLVSPAGNHDAVRSACQVLYVHLGTTGLV
jgi:hypothetical protein